MYVQRGVWGDVGCGYGAVSGMGCAEWGVGCVGSVVSLPHHHLSVVRLGIVLWRHVVSPKPPRTLCSSGPSDSFPMSLMSLLPAGAVTGNATFASFLSSLLAVQRGRPGVHLC